ncbi:MAG: cobalamin-dependent protein, partial [Bacteroidales bacterium]|nr:cobalamin-dependent protein [Bacteroidales bacterium]
MHKTILLISLNRHHVPYPVYPLGISYLKAYLNKHLPEKYDIEIVDCNISDDILIEEKIRELSPAYIGFSMRNVDGANSLDRTNFINEYARIIKSVKEHTDAVTIIGGSAFSIYPKELFESISPHYGIIGEGEQSLLKLVTKLERGETPYDIEG